MDLLFAALEGDSPPPSYSEKTHPFFRVPFLLSRFPPVDPPNTRAGWLSGELSFSIPAFVERVSRKSATDMLALNFPLFYLGYREFSTEHRIRILLLFPQRLSAWPTLPTPSSQWTLVPIAGLIPQFFLPPFAVR